MVLHDRYKNKKPNIDYPTHREYDFFHDLFSLGKIEEIKKIVSGDKVPRNQLEQFIQKLSQSSKSEKLTKEYLKVLNNQKEIVDVGGGWKWVALVKEDGSIRGPLSGKKPYFALNNS